MKFHGNIFIIIIVGIDGWWFQVIFCSGDLFLKDEKKLHVI